MRRASMVLTGLLLALGAPLLAACSSSSDEEPAARESPTAPPTQPISLSLLVFNVEYGGSKATDAVLADLDADVVGVLESYNRLPEIAAAAGYPYYDVGLQILSKYPILEPSGADGLYSYIEVRPGEAVAMVNTHLDYVQDGPNRLERGVPVADVLATEDKVRLSSVEKLVPSVTELLGDDWPVLFTGDLNQPSHLDWTARTPPATAASVPSRGRSARPCSTQGCGTPTARRGPTPSRIPATRGGRSRAARARPGGSTTPTWADRSRWSAARSSASRVARASTAPTPGGPPTTAPCSRSSR